MCGFVGIFDFNGLSENDYNDIREAAIETNYRGPNDNGFYKSNRCGIGFNRLSIVDLNAKSQPLINKNKNIILVCNGEIYNYLSLKKELEAKYVFETNTDTEVLLHGYEEWGDDFWQKIRGMFCIAVYDKRNETIKLVRDHAGIKPLHYLIDGNRIYFTNDLKSFFFHKKLKINIRYESILSYLSFRYVLGENTFYKNIKDVMPGEILSFKKNDFNKKVFWKLNNNFISSIDEKSAIEQLDLKIKTAVKTHLIGDVKIGVFVSGGLDSSLIAHYMNQNNLDLEGFGTSVRENGYDEEKYIRKLAEDENIKLNLIEIDKNNFIDNIDNIIKFKSEPASIPHETGFYLMSKEMQNKIKVVMSGEGADELFGGYGRLFQSPIDFYKSKIHNFKYQEVNHFIDRYSIFKESDKVNFLNLEAFNSKIHDEESINYLKTIFNDVKDKNYFDKMYYVMFKIHLVNMLNRLDRMTMASSIEARVPFLDRDLIEFVYSLPSSMKIRWKSHLSKYYSVFKSSNSISENLDIPKYILKKVAETKINKKIVYRKKQAFPLPLNKWMKNELGDYFMDNLSRKNSKLADLINVKTIENKLLKKDFDNSEDLDGKKYWMLLNLDKWLNDFPHSSN